MSEIRNSDIQKRIIEEAKLQVGIDDVPQQLTDKILPVLISNPKGKKRILIYNDNNTRNIFNNGLYVPVGKKWVIKQALMRLVTDATVADREVQLETMNASGFRVLEVYADAVQPASQTEYYMFLPNVIPAESPTGYHYLPLNDGAVLFEGANIWFAIGSLQAGDNVRFNCIIEETDLLVDDEYLEQVVP